MTFNIRARVLDKTYQKYLKYLLCLPKRIIEASKQTNKQSQIGELMRWQVVSMGIVPMS